MQMWLVNAMESTTAMTITRTVNSRDYQFNSKEIGVGIESESENGI